MKKEITEKNMNIAVHNPMFSGAGGLHGWILEFMEIYRPVVYVSHLRYLPRLVHFFLRFHLNPFHYRFVFSVERLNRTSDVLICFNGHPYLKQNRPPKDFKGLKIYHLMDYAYFPKRSNQALQEGGVDFVFGYSRHDKYCEFFQSAYPSFRNRVIPIPFGFAKRFQELTPFEERKNKVIASGSVNSFNDPVHNIPAFQELNEFFRKRGEQFMHKFRRMLVEREEELKDIMDSKLPHYPQVKDFSYDIVEVLNQYVMSVSCESLQYFPPAKTFEGPASGAVLICSDHPCFKDLGFQDGANCIMHKQFDLKDFQEKVSFYLTHPTQLARIQDAGTSYVRENFNHKKIAGYVYEEIERRYQTGSSHIV